MKINLNKLCQRVAEQEGGKVNLSIAQIKEVVRLTFAELQKETASDVLQTLGK